MEAVDFSGEQWVFAVIGGNGHLIRLTEEGALETRFLGELTDEREAAAT